MGKGVGRASNSRSTRPGDETEEGGNAIHHQKHRQQQVVQNLVLGREVELLQDVRAVGEQAPAAVVVTVSAAAATTTTAGGGGGAGVGGDARAPDGGDVAPLVDHQQLVGVPEPGEVPRPRQPPHNAPVVEEEPGEEHEGQHGGARPHHRRGTVLRGGGQEMPETGRRVGGEDHHPGRHEETADVAAETDHPVVDADDHQRHDDVDGDLGQVGGQVEGIQSVQAAAVVRQDDGDPRMEEGEDAVALKEAADDADAEEGPVDVEDAGLVVDLRLLVLFFFFFCCCCCCCSSSSSSSSQSSVESEEDSPEHQAEEEGGGRSLPELLLPAEEHDQEAAVVDSELPEPGGRPARGGQQPLRNAFRGGASGACEAVDLVQYGLSSGGLLEDVADRLRLGQRQ